MRKLLCLLTLAWLLNFPVAGPAFADTTYLSSLPDIPLMPQMKELKDADVTFDKAQGRIIQETVKAPGLVRADVLKFYHETLPQLGWKPVSESGTASRFLRNGEQLIVNLDKLASEGLVGFAVSPIQP